MYDPNKPIEFLKGVGPVKADLLKRQLNVFFYKDLLDYFPFRYSDRTKILSIKEIDNTNDFIQIKGHIKGLKKVGIGKSSRLLAHFCDATGSVELLWFKGIKWVEKFLRTDSEYLLFGKPNFFKGNISFIHPELSQISHNQKGKLYKGLYPVYTSTELLKRKGLDSKGISKLLQNLLSETEKGISETLPDRIIKKYKFPTRKEAYHWMHFPEKISQQESALRRFKFEELFFMQLQIQKFKHDRDKNIKGFLFPRVGDFFNNYYKHYLPFSLTQAQKKVMKEIRMDMNKGRQMNRLLQGDVGSGKTIVAIMSMLLAIDNKYQTCLMAPTEILASQHYSTVKNHLSALGVRFALLTGSTRQKERKDLLEELASGNMHILIGTHALIEEKVRFANLGLIIIDEQHRFGVAQRAKLWQKSKRVPHVMVMTATPIPRTLAMTVYGDLEISVIDELPPGRKPVKTVHFYERNRKKMFQFLHQQIIKGKQAYIVFPLINESKKLDLKNLSAGIEQIMDLFPPPKYQISIIHGQMSAAEKEHEIAKFKKKQSHIMVATTVIEVGVDIPNASVMVIENAERFGLSQLHQLRGRVGRDSSQAYCILMTKNELSTTAKKRISALLQSNDGFFIAETDMKLRGQGNIYGTEQSGIPALKIASLIEDENIVRLAKDTAWSIINDDPKLSDPKNEPIAQQLKTMDNTYINWSRIA